jgi:L-fuculose-phosphate aldolase
MTTYFELKEQICEIGRRLYAHGYVASNAGNISYKLSEDEILTTPTAVSKGYMDPGMIVLVDRHGKRRYGEWEPSSEIKMHLGIYVHRPDVRAVVHAHPPIATGFAVAGIPLAHCVLPEVVLSLGGVPLAPYGTPSTEELPQQIIPLLEKADAFLLANHGAVTIGEDLFQAYYRMEMVEHFAQILLTAKQLGKVNFLTKENLEKLREIREAAGIKGKQFDCSLCRLCFQTDRDESNGP